MIRRAWADLRYFVGMAGVHFSYWIRPFDMVADRRHWRWERPACVQAQIQLAAMPPEQQAALEQSLREYLDRRDDQNTWRATP